MDITVKFQRVEGFFIFLLATIFYFYSDFSWPLYLLFLFAFDISILGYMVNKRVGAVCYNLVHSMIFPSALGIALLFVDNGFMTGLCCLWFAHIGFDRAGGYGLKFFSGFEHTHLGAIGKSKKHSH